jgi:hypothetical protein
MGTTMMRYESIISTPGTVDIDIYQPEVPRIRISELIPILEALKYGIFKTTPLVHPPYQP